MSETSSRSPLSASRGESGAPRPPLRIACMVSGRGTTVMNLADRIERDQLPLTIVLVAASRPGVPAIDAAAKRGLPTTVIAREGATPGGAIDDAIDRALTTARPDLICLCGYLRLFRVGPWVGRVINIHPGPLPAFGGRGMYGTRVHRAVIDASLAETRICVHLVDAEYDRGPIIAEQRVMVLPADTPESLEARVRLAEYELLPQVLRRIATGEIDLNEIAARAGRADLSSRA